MSEISSLELNLNFSSTPSNSSSSSSSSSSYTGKPTGEYAQRRKVMSSLTAAYSAAAQQKQQQEEEARRKKEEKEKWKQAKRAAKAAGQPLPTRAAEEKQANEDGPENDAEDANKRTPWKHVVRALPKIRRSTPDELDKKAVNMAPDVNQVEDASLFGESKNAGKINPFEKLGLHPDIAMCLQRKLNIVLPTRIQSLSFPLLSTGKDALIKSETGSGKTLAYLLPILHQIKTKYRIGRQTNKNKEDIKVKKEKKIKMEEEKQNNEDEDGEEDEEEDDDDDDEEEDEQSFDPNDKRLPLRRASGLLSLVLSPTRELVLQIYNVLNSLLSVSSVFAPLVTGILIGGEKKKSEKARLRKGVHILIATPGRMLDHLRTTEALRDTLSGIPHISSSQQSQQKKSPLIPVPLNYLILDESDRLMDLGFERDVREIISLIEELTSKRHDISQYKVHQRQTLLVSATLSAELTQLAKDMLNQPVSIGFGNQTSKLLSSDELHEKNLPSALTHQFLQVESRHRLVALAAFLRKGVVEAEAIKKKEEEEGIEIAKRTTHGFKAVVFFSTCASVEFHHLLFSHAYWPDRQQLAEDDEERTPLLDTMVLKLHGNMPQHDRRQAFDNFRKTSSGILLTTDVAGRGLDLPMVDYVVQYDPPEERADYIHRVGRTARMGRRGQAVIFLTSSELPYLEHLKEKNIEPEPLSLSSILLSLHTGTKKNVIYENGDGSATPAGAILQKQCESLTKHNPQLHDLSITAFTAFLRAYAAYPKAVKPIFHPNRLHLGHVAKSFSLTEQPSIAARNAAQQKVKEQEREARDSRFLSKMNKKRGRDDDQYNNNNRDDDGDDGERNSGRRDRGGNNRPFTKNSNPRGNSKPSFSKNKPNNKPMIRLGGRNATGNNDRARTVEIAQQFKKKKLDLASEFAS